MSRSKVAIYMCCYNNERFVAEAIETIINQTYLNWELWIANDGSTDGSASIIESYHDERIHFFNFKDNTRLVGAQKCLLEEIKKCECEYIVGTASDDKWMLERLEKQVEVLDNHPEYGACFSWDKVIFEDKEDDELYSDEYSYSHLVNRSRYSWLERILLNSNCFNACSAMVRKDIYFDLGGYNQYFIRLGDYRLWLNILLNYPIYMIEEPLVYYRRHGNNLSNDNIFNSMASINEAYNIRKNAYSIINKKDFYHIFYNYLIYDAEKDEDYRTDKIFLFACGETTCEMINDQLCIEEWLKYSDNSIIMEILKNKYDMDIFFLEKFKENCGITVYATKVFDSLKNIYKFEKPSLEEVFINKYISKYFGKDEIIKYICNPFYSFAYYVIKNNSGIKFFEKMKNDIYSLRKEILESKTEKVMHIICEINSKININRIIEKYANEYKIYLSFVKKDKEYYLQNQVELSTYNNSEYVELYNMNNHSLDFGFDKDIAADVIYYIDCLGDEYQCTRMIRGYNLSITQRALLDKNKFMDQVDLNATISTLSSVEYIS